MGNAILIIGATFLLAAVYSAVTGGSIVSFIAALAVFGALCTVAFLAFTKDSSRKLLKKYKGNDARPLRSKTNELGSGDLAAKEHVLRWLKRHGEGDTALPVADVKGANGIICKKGELVIPSGERNRHILIIAKTGSGKTTKLILPVLLNDCLCKQRSTIVIDSKPEMWTKLAAFTRKYNPEKNIMLFNPLDTLRSQSWNILAKVENDTDAKLIANTIIMATESPGARQDTPFFKNNALMLLNGIMVGLLKDPNERLSMPRIHELVNTGMQELCDWLEARPEAIRSTRTFVELARSGSQNADTIMSELGMRLSAWDLKAIRATTFQDELDLERLISEPTLFIVELRESELEMLRPMANVIVIEMLRYLTKRAENCPGQTLPRPVSLVIDEFASALGRLPDIHVKLNTLRSRNVSIVAAIQSIAQIKANYDKDADSVLAGFSTKILMPALDFQDAEWASKETGTMTIRYTTQSAGSNKRLVDVFSSKNDNINEQLQQRAVLTPDEIGRPADNASTFFMPNTPVFQGHLIPYYQVKEYVEKMDAVKNIDFNLRDSEIDYQEKIPEIRKTQAKGAGGQMQVQPNQVAANTLSPEQLKESLNQIKLGLDWGNTVGAPRQWWEAFEAANPNNITAVLNLAKEIGRRAATITEFYAVFAKANSQDLQYVLGLLDIKLLEQRKPRVGWDSCTPTAKEWWIAFEAANKGNLVTLVSLVDELEKRRATINEFFAAYVHSNHQSVPEVLVTMEELRKAENNASKAAAKTTAEPASAATSQNVASQAAPVTEAKPISATIAATVTNGSTVSSVINGTAAKTQSAPAATSNGATNGSSEHAPHTVAQSTVSQRTVTQTVIGERAEASEQTPSAAASEPVKQTPVEKPQQPASGFKEATKPSGAACAKSAAQNVQLQSYYEMGEQFLKDGNVVDFRALVGLAADDKRFTESDIAQLKALATHYGFEA